MSETKKSKFPFGLRLTVYVIVIGLMVSIFIPNLRQAKVVRAMNACEANLKQLDGATRSWSLENKKGLDDTVDFQEVVRYMRGGVSPTCPAGGSYQVNRVKDNPTCSLAATLGHSLR
jgi:competence protein ComGC